MIKQRGFTMVELLIVVLIIGILVSIAVPNYYSALERSKCAQAIHNIKTMRSAMLAYYVENQTFVGADLATIGALVNATFISNSDWTYAPPTVAAGTFTLTATRQTGTHIGKTITLNQDEVWGGTYPRDNP